MSLISLDTNITFSMSVTDRHASADWYAAMLGFDLIYHADDVGWSELGTNTAGVTIGLGEHTEPAPGNCVPVFGIADLDRHGRSWNRHMSDLMARQSSLTAW